MPFRLALCFLIRPSEHWKFQIQLAQSATPVLVHYLTCTASEQQMDKFDNNKKLAKENLESIQFLGKNILGRTDDLQITEFLIFWPVLLQNFE